MGGEPERLWWRNWRLTEVTVDRIPRFLLLSSQGKEEDLQGPYIYAIQATPLDLENNYFFLEMFGNIPLLTGRGGASQDSMQGRERHWTRQIVFTSNVWQLFFSLEVTRKSDN